MPRRRRRNKRRDQLTLPRHLMLSLGPRPGEPPPERGSEEWETLRACFEQHRYRDGEDFYPPGSWGHSAFELGHVRANPLVPADDEGEP
jgi:hypothetical protein